MREHIIVALVGTRPAKVECDHCHKQHLYRAAAPGEKAKSTAAAKPRVSRAKKSSRPALPEIDVAARIAGREARAYGTSEKFGLGDVVRHASFGVGVVVAHPGPQKVEIAFPEGTKLLSHDRAAVAASTLVRPPPRVEDERTPVTDAPPPKPRSRPRR